MKEKGLLPEYYRNMKTRVSILAIITLTIVALSACGKKDIDGYSYASYRRYTGDTPIIHTSVYIEGTLKKYDQYYTDNQYSVIVTISESKGKEWLYDIGTAPKYDEKKLEQLVGKKIRCFGNFKGLGNYHDSCNLGDSKTPCLDPGYQLIQNDEVMLETKSGDVSYTLDDLLASKEYVIEWYEKNCDLKDEVITDNNDNKYDGKYFIINGVVEDNVKNSNGRYNVRLIQKKNGILSVANIKINKFWNEDDNEFDFIKRDDAIALYCYMDSNESMQVLCFNKIDLDYTVGDFYNENSTETKEYILSNGDEILVSLSFTNGEKNLNYIFKVQDELHATLVLIDAVEALPPDINAGVSIIKGDDMITAVYDSKEGKYTDVASIDSKGNCTFGFPDWIELEEDTYNKNKEDINRYDDEIKEIISDYLAEYNQ